MRPPFVTVYCPEEGMDKFDRCVHRCEKRCWERHDPFGSDESRRAWEACVKQCTDTCWERHCKPYERPEEEVWESLRRLLVVAAVMALTFGAFRAGA